MVSIGYISTSTDVPATAPLNSADEKEGSGGHIAGGVQACGAAGSLDIIWLFMFALLLLFWD